MYHMLLGYDNCSKKIKQNEISQQNKPLLFIQFYHLNFMEMRGGIVVVVRPVIKVKHIRAIISNFCPVSKFDKSHPNQEKRLAIFPN